MRKKGEGQERKDEGKDMTLGREGQGGREGGERHDMMKKGEGQSRKDGGKDMI